jgi:hypothetical protein
MACPAGRPCLNSSQPWPQVIRMRDAVLQMRSELFFDINERLKV